jgi:hypothetical protein
MENKNILLTDDFNENDVIINDSNKKIKSENYDSNQEEKIDHVDEHDDDDENDDEDDEHDEDDDDEDDDEDNYEYDDIDETTIYVISINDIPYFYENNYEDAKKRINTFSKKIVLGHEKTYDSYYKIIDEDEIHIVVNLDFILFKYNYTFYKIKIHTARKYK